MVFAISGQPAYPCPMTDPGLIGMEQQLLAANATVARLTLTNAELTGELAQVQRVNKKLKRNARREASSFKEQLAVALRGGRF